MQEKAKCGQCFHGGKMGEEAMKNKKKKMERRTTEGSDSGEQKEPSEGSETLRRCG